MKAPSADGFARLLAWFDDDEVAAQAKLNHIRQQLVSFFRKRGIAPDDVDDLVQDVVMTTALKCSGGLPPYPNPEPLMMGIARFVRLRHFRAQSTRREIDHADEILETLTSDDPKAADAECLESILTGLPPHERALLIEYYGSDKQERAELAKTLTLSAGALRVRVFRLKQQVQERLFDCLRPRPVR